MGLSTHRFMPVPKKGNTRLKWEIVEAPPGLPAPKPLTVRVQSIPARHYFPEHWHPWHQMVYAISGALTVAVEGQSFVISPQQAVWLPVGLRHRVGTLCGAEFRSLWIEPNSDKNLPRESALFEVSPLLKALIIEAAAIEGQKDSDGYSDRITQLILDQIGRARQLQNALTWPREGPLSALCETLYADPANPKKPQDWARHLGMSERTLARRFETEIGMSFRAWRGRLRLFKAVELLGGGRLSVTQTAMELGYGSTSAFVFAFRAYMGNSPREYIRKHKEDRNHFSI